MYECLNLDTGEINAVKQVSNIPPVMYHDLSVTCVLKVVFHLSLSLSLPLPLSQLSIQEKDTSAIETIVHEISLFQKLNHPNIVKFYGVEVHHVSRNDT